MPIIPYIPASEVTPPNTAVTVTTGELDGGKADETEFIDDIDCGGADVS
jgi:hypothetical protein